MVLFLSLNFLSSAMLGSSRAKCPLFSSDVSVLPTVFVFSVLESIFLFVLVFLVASSFFVLTAVINLSLHLFAYFSNPRVAGLFISQCWRVFSIPRWFVSCSLFTLCLEFNVLCIVINYISWKSESPLCSGWRAGLWYCSKRFRTPIALLCSLLEEFPWEKYKLPSSLKIWHKTRK